jgi:hypothetical protein
MEAEFLNFFEMRSGELTSALQTAAAEETVKLVHVCCEKLQEKFVKIENSNSTL